MTPRLAGSGARQLRQADSCGHLGVAFRDSGAVPVIPFAWSPPRTLISNGARQSLFKSKPPYETSFLEKLYDPCFLQNALLQEARDNLEGES